MVLTCILTDYSDYCMKTDRNGSRETSQKAVVMRQARVGCLDAEPGSPCWSTVPE